MKKHHIEDPLLTLSVDILKKPVCRPLAAAINGMVSSLIEDLFEANEDIQEFPVDLLKSELEKRMVEVNKMEVDISKQNWRFTIHLHTSQV